jgi:hypothetical protein
MISIDQQLGVLGLISEELILSSYYYQFSAAVALRVYKS